MRFLVKPTAPVTISSLSMSKRFIYDALPVINFLNSYKLDRRSLNVVNICWAMSMQRCIYSKFSNFRTIIAAAYFMLKTSVKIVWQDPNNMPTSSPTFLTKLVSVIAPCPVRIPFRPFFYRIQIVLRSSFLLCSDSSIIQNYFLHYCFHRLLTCSVDQDEFRHCHLLALVQAVYTAMELVLCS